MEAIRGLELIRKKQKEGVTDIVIEYPNRFQRLNIEKNLGNLRQAVPGNTNNSIVFEPEKGTKTIIYFNIVQNIWVPAK